MPDTTKPRISPQEAGRRGGLIGGRSRSAAKLAACRRNGFQRTAPADQPAPQQTDKWLVDAAFFDNKTVQPTETK